MTDKEEGSESDDDKRNDQWLKDHFVDLIQMYPREWIAVLDRNVIAKSSTKTEVEEMADKIANGREYSIYFIPPTETGTDAGYYSHGEENPSS